MWADKPTRADLAVPGSYLPAARAAAARKALMDEEVGALSHGKYFDALVAKIKGKK